MRFRIFVCISFATLSASATFAHGPQIQVTDTGDKIVTRKLLSDDPYGDSLTEQKSVYVLPVLKAISGSPSTDYWTVMPNNVIDPIIGSNQFQFGPGLAYGYGHTFTDGFHFTVNVLGALRRWDGSAFVNNLGPEAIGGFRGDATASADQIVVSGVSSGTQGLLFSNISRTYNDDSHGSMRFRLLGDGGSALSEPADGLYLLTLQITSNQPGLEPSDPFNFLLYKNVSTNTLNSSLASLNVSSSLVQFIPVPEPNVFAIVGSGGLSICLTRKRRQSLRGIL